MPHPKQKAPAPSAPGTPSVASARFILGEREARLLGHKKPEGDENTASPDGLSVVELLHGGVVLHRFEGPEEEAILFYEGLCRAIRADAEAAAAEDQKRHKRGEQQ